MRTSVVLFIIYTVTSVAGLGLLKHGLPALSAALTTGGGSAVALFPAGVGGLLYVGSFGIWLVILNRWPLSSAYPIAIGSTLALSTIVAGMVLGESISGTKIIGIILILLGILVIFQEAA